MTIPTLKNNYTADEYTAYIKEVQAFGNALSDEQLAEAVDQTLNETHILAYLQLSDIAGTRSRKAWLREHDEQAREAQRRIDSHYAVPPFTYNNR